MSVKKLSEMTKEELISYATQLRKRKKFGLVWDNKPEHVVEQCNNELPVLEEEKSKSIDLNPTWARNLLIEGDNFHALSVLNYTHPEKIDVIYIDPPYNTGNKTWRYNNQFVDKDDPFKHSKFLTFLSNRIRLARNLLKDSGIIIITIDDYEIANVRLLMDEVFGEENRLGLVTIMHNPRGRSDDKYFATSHEYALFYAKNRLHATTYKLALTEEQVELFPLEDDYSNYRLLPLKRTGSNSTPNERPKLFYPIYYCPDPEDISLDSQPGYVEILPKDSNGNDRVWRWGKEKVTKEWRTELIFTNSKGVWTIHTKDRIKGGRKPKTVWVDPSYDASSHGTMLLQKILGKRKLFDYPKSIYAVFDCLSVGCRFNREALILDFFAGSGTTGHATLLLNKLDNGNRKFILCTDNENEIAEKVCYPRILGVLNGYKNVEGIPANVGYYRTSFISKSKVSDDTRRKLVTRSVEMICIREDTFSQKADTSGYKIYTNSSHSTGILFDLNQIEEFKIALGKLRVPSSIYVFSLTNDTFAEDFENMYIPHEICPIPESILEVYRKVFRE